MIEGIICRAMEYRERAVKYFMNFEEERLRENFDKAGEALWGVISCLLNAIHLLEKGKPITDHQMMRQFAVHYLVSMTDEGERLVGIFKRAEKLHANFYHSFLDRDEFNELCNEIIELIKVLEELYNREMSKF